MPGDLADILEYSLAGIGDVLVNAFAVSFKSACERRGETADNVVNIAIFCRIIFTHHITASYGNLSATQLFKDAKRKERGDKSNILHLDWLCSYAQYAAFAEVIDETEMSHDQISKRLL